MCIVAVAATAFAQTCAAVNLTIDLGYGIYRGYHNDTTGLNVWKGIRFAQAPIGNLRWQAPRAPSADRGAVVNATTFGSNCPQTYPAVPGAPFIPGNEDCLFLNVWAPPAAKTLPVLVWIHGGGYGLGDGTQDMSSIINTNGNSFVVVSIQYRLGAFGFLASEEVKAKGALNAGILDQAFALQWVQDKIALFGGDPQQVTISGESAGGGSVMYHAMAGQGSPKNKLFEGGIAASPYLVAQYLYKDPVPTSRYYNFSSLAGCPSSGTAFACLVGKDSDTLQHANANITTFQTYGTWAFLPVTDNSYITALPSVQLNQGKVSGTRILVGNNADEGALFVPPTISTESDLIAWLKQEFESLTSQNISQILAAYPTSSASDGPKFETDGVNPPTALDISEMANGQLQRAYNIYAEASFVCPGYWLDSAFTGRGKTAYHYQYSVPFAYHGSDLAGYFGPPTTNQGPDFVRAFQQVWGNFVTKGNPSIPATVAMGSAKDYIDENAVGVAPDGASVTAWPAWSVDPNRQLQIVLNQTGGVPYTAAPIGVPLIQYMDPGLRNNITVANAYTWEGGRGRRCEFWKGMSPQIPA
ncbi:alpha/beta-hydrolase [Thozetella sp. PMI_491]|nr:alpha/beta-hydrolase [Thozetella sp. PMI_491]